MTNLCSFRRPTRKLQSPILASRSTTAQRAFTLIELVIVISIIGLGLIVFVQRSDTSLFWKQESMLRQIVELVPFLHNQAVADQAYYRLEFNLETNTYRIGVMKPEGNADENLQDIAQDAGNLTLELAAYLSPSLGDTQTLIPPPDYPSLFENKELLIGTSIADIRTMRGIASLEAGNEVAYVMFSPRGFSEFAVIHLNLINEQQATILVNPFTGLAELYRDYRDFEWTYQGGDQRGSS